MMKACFMVRPLVLGPDARRSLQGPLPSRVRRFTRRLAGIEPPVGSAACRWNHHAGWRDMAPELVSVQLLEPDRHWSRAELLERPNVPRNGDVRRPGCPLAHG